MLDGLKPYPAYKESGVPWLGRIPENWSVARNGRLFSRRNEPGTADLPILEVSLHTGVRVRELGGGGRKQLMSDIGGYRRAVHGDIAYNTMRMWQGAVGVVPATGLVSPAYVVARPHADVDARYFTSLFRTAAYLEQTDGYSRGIVKDRNRLYWEDFKRISSPVPPPEVQVGIVRFLDCADRRIRRYIRARQVLIKLLEEERRTVLNRLVTRGLDPSTSIKSTCVDWYEAIPEHWEIVSMGRVVWSAVDGPHHSPRYLESGIPFLSARNIRVDGWSLDDAKFISQADFKEFSRRVAPTRGDVLYTKGGTTGVARVVDLEFPFHVWVHVAVLKVVRSRVLPSYLAMVLNSTRCYEQAQLFTRGATNQDLGLSRMKRILFPLPPISEQEAILRIGEEGTDRIVAAIRAARREITLASEVRTRLIADVVTGKLDVREAAAQLPEETIAPDATEYDELDTPVEDDADNEPDADSAGSEA